ncbi:lantibiotic dehydratase [Streptomyces sp. NPDC058657]|uniref:lantibiotic dehydratase n=1 Tax=unclassified Streptomyces TaxID=2593676 RepID=UPI003664ECA6
MTGTTVPFGDKWQVWEQFGLRGAGFPAAGVLRLAPEGLAAAADKFGTREALVGPRWKAFEEVFGEAAVATARELQQIAAQPAFQTAVAWQNRAVLGRAIAPFVRWEPTAAGRTSGPRQREELIAHYWQRFCVKNDTIGFFGPVGWGRIDTAERGILVDPGERLIARSRTYFSSWSMDALAKTIGNDPALRDWTAPRRVPFVRVDAQDGAHSVTLPGRPPQPITPPMHQVLVRCDGTRTARTIRQELADDLGPAQVTAILEVLVERRWIVWRLEIPATTYPEQYLRAWLEGIDDPVPRQRGLDLLGALERGRDRVQAVGDDVEELCAALAALESDFAELTDTAAQREKSEHTAPNRALVYSDCVRTATARIGTEVLAALAPLDLLMTSAVWLTSRLADQVLGLAEQVYDRLAGAAGEGGRVDLAAFWFACMPILHGDAVTGAAEIQREFWRRWEGILGLPAAGGRLRLASADIADRVREAFGERGASWTAARYLSPDVMIAAEDEAAAERGEFELVLGELHVATNTLGNSLFVNQHPAPEELFAQTGRDHPAPRLMPLLPKEHKSRLSARVRHFLVRPEDYYVALLDHTADPHRPRTVLSADVAVERREGRLVVVLPDGAVFDVLDVFSHALTTLVMDLCRLLPDADHSPRVTVDRMVLARETWRFAGAGLEFAKDKSEARRFVRARRWWAGEELPRFVFVVSPSEPRPFFVDFESPAYVNLFAKAVRRLVAKDPEGRLTLTEMLPAPEQSWLTDEQGRRYTSELRFVVVGD